MRLLAAIVAAPCTAPFMAAATGAALVRSPGTHMVAFTGSVETGRRVRVEPIITRPGQALPKSRLIATQRGEVRLELTPAPVLLYPEA